jgi:type VI secretion system protein VasG
MIGEITRLQLGRIKKRIEGAHGVPFTFSDAVVDLIVDRCQELESGGRMIDAILTNSMLPAISGEYLRRLMEAEPITGVHVDVKDGDFDYAFA